MPKGKKAAGKQTQATPLETVIEANEQQPTATTNSDEGASESSEQWLRNVITPIEAARVHLEATMTDTRAYLRQVQEERWRSSDLGKWCADKDRKLERLSIDPTSVEPPKQNISWNPKKEDVVRIEFLFDICTISIRKNFDGSTEEMQEMMADFYCMTLMLQTHFGFRPTPAPVDIHARLWAMWTMKMSNFGKESILWDTDDLAEAVAKRFPGQTSTIK